MATITSDYDRAVRLHRSGNWKRARQWYERVLERNPRHGAALHGLGELMVRLSQPGEAIALIGKAIAAGGPKHEYCASLGRLFLLQFSPREAAACFRQAIAANPLDAGCYRDLSRALVQTGDLAGAATSAEQAVELEPGSGDAWCGLGTVLCRRGDTVRAAECFRRALALAPSCAEAAYNLGVLLQSSDEREEAERMFERAVEVRPDYAFAHNNLGNLLYSRGDATGAVRHYRAALASEPSFSRAHMNLGIALLSLGDFENGCEEYEWRSRVPGAAVRASKLPRWKGEQLREGGVLLYADQGLGDAIQFVRYAPMVRERAARVVVECAGALRRLVAGAPGVESVVESWRTAEGCAFEAPLASMPQIFGTRAESVPSPISYLRAPQGAVEEWRVEAAGFRVGVAWAGNPAHGNDRNRSIPAGVFEPLARMEGVRLFSLQKPPDPRLRCTVHLGATFSDLADTAAVVSQMDLVISADTAVAHLAGALGVPVWTLIPFAPDWRWMWGREDTPWYPTMRLFRQATAGDWEAVMVRVREELARVAGGRG